MNPTATPGPWRINPYAATYEAVSTDAPEMSSRLAALKEAGLSIFKAVSIGTSTGQVALIPLDESNMANARLIAAAPKMEMTLRHIASCQSHHPKDVIALAQRVLEENNDG